MSTNKKTELEEVADSLDGVAGAINKLGLSDASTPPDALELMSKEVHDGTKEISESLDGIASSISDHDLSEVAAAIKSIDIQQLADAISDGNYNELSLSVAITTGAREIASGLKDLASVIREMRGVAV
jgi:hypothetical protein